MKPPRRASYFGSRRLWPRPSRRASYSADELAVRTTPAGGPRTPGPTRIPHHRACWGASSHPRPDPRRVSSLVGGSRTLPKTEGACATLPEHVAPGDELEALASPDPAPSKGGVTSRNADMANRRTRKLAKRRDRRKAKESGWRRGAKGSMTRVGHGATGNVGHTLHRLPQRRPVLTPEAPPPCSESRPARRSGVATIAEHLTAKG